MSAYTDFVNFFEVYNRYRAETFSVYLTFNGQFNDISPIFVAQNFITCTCLRYVDIIHEIERYRFVNILQHTHARD